MKSSVFLAGAAAAIAGSVLLAQQNSTAPQPRPNALPAVAPAQPKFGSTVPRPEGMLPKVPDASHVRAVAEILDELEPERRGAYGGAVGYIGAGGARMDLAITIRTCVIAEGVANVQAAAGIVLDSVPEMEWAETESKMRAMLTAIGRVREAMGRAERAP